MSLPCKGNIVEITKSHEFHHVIAHIVILDRPESECSSSGNMPKGGKISWLVLCISLILTFHYSPSPRLDEELILD